MNCPSCNSNNTKVIDSRLSGEGFSIRRRRSCQGCNFRFSTIEEIEILDLVVIKRDGHRENYNRDKLIRGFYLFDFEYIHGSYRNFQAVAQLNSADCRILVVHLIIALV